MKNRHLTPLLLLAMLMAVQPTHAQRIHAFLSSGVTLSQIEGDELKGFRKAGFTGGVGAIASLDHYEDWRLSLEALFSQRGSYNGSGNPYSLDLTLNYVDIPLMVHYRDPWGGILVGVGLNYSRLTDQPHGRMKFDTSYFIPDTTNMHFRANDFSIVADIRFFVWRGLMFNLRWQYSLAPAKREWNFYQYDGKTPLRDDTGEIVLDADDQPIMVDRWKTYTNNCYNNSLTFRLIWQF